MRGRLFNPNPNRGTWRLNGLMDYVTFTLIVDDIVWPDGHTAMARLGGGGPQTAFAVRMWTGEQQTVGLAAGVGNDLPELCKEWFKAMRIDMQGLVQWDGFKTLRAWQVLEMDGGRTQVWRTPVGDDVWGMLRPKLRTLPEAYQKARAFHVGVHPSGLDVDFVRELRDSGAEVVSIEPYTHALDIVPREELEALLTSAHIFSPNEMEAFSLVGPGEPLEVIRRLVEAGAQIVCLRRGEEGCVVHRADTGETWHVPAVNMASTIADECLESVARAENASGSKAKLVKTSGVDGPGKAAGVSEGSAPTFLKQLPPETAASRSAETEPDGPRLDIATSVRAAWAVSIPPLPSPSYNLSTEERPINLDSPSVAETTPSEEDGQPRIYTGSPEFAADGVNTRRPGRLKDPTGCGNAFCGGFLVGWLEHRDLLTGALYGSVAASFMLEHEGIPPPSPWRHQEACKRLENLRNRARRLL